MAKEETNVTIDDTMDMELTEMPKEVKSTKAKHAEPKPLPRGNDEELVSCLRNETIIIRHVPKAGMVSDPKHVLFGGMAEGAKRTYVVPRLQSGMFVNVLTNSEKAYLEYVMGLEYNALSIFNKNNSFWDDSNPDGISRVTLTKQDNRLNLSNPEEYIKYKILLANKDYIAPSMQALEDKPKATYEFVIISEGEETKVAKQNMSTTMQCYKEFGKIEDDKEKLRVIVEILDGRPTAPNVKLEFLQTKVNELIQASSKLFLKVITDPLLDTKVLIRRSLEKGTIFKKGDYHYLKDGTPMCEINQEPTFNIAAKFLNLPKNQEVKFSLEAKLK